MKVKIQVLIQVLHTEKSLMCLKCCLLRNVSWFLTAADAIVGNSVWTCPLHATNAVTLVLNVLPSISVLLEQDYVVSIAMDTLVSHLYSFMELSLRLSFGIFSTLFG